MFVVFPDYAYTANIYTHEFNIACMCCRKAAIQWKINPSNSVPAKVYTLEIILAIYISYSRDVPTLHAHARLCGDGGWD